MEENIKPRKIYYREFETKPLPNKEIVIRFFINAYIVKDYDAVSNLISTDYVNHGLTNIKGSSSYINFLKDSLESFDDIRLEILQIFEEQNLVSTLIRFSFLHSKDSFGFKATNKRIVFDTIQNFRIKNGKIIESWGIWPTEIIKKQIKN